MRDLKSERLNQKGMPVSRGAMIAIVMLILISGCGEPKSVSDHTHLWIGDKTHNVWTYERATLITTDNQDDPSPDQYLKTEVKSGEKVLLESGQVVSYDGKSLRVGKQLIKVKNVHVEPNGTIRENAFIRSRSGE